MPGLKKLITRRDIMNKILFAFLIAGLFVLPIVFAEETNQTQQLTTEEQAVVGFTPDHPLYGLERAVEKVRLALTFNEQAKAEMHVQLAYERLVEAKSMEQKNKTQFVPELVKDYEDEVAAAEASIAKAETHGQNVTAVRMHVMEMTAKHIEVLQRVMENAPESAQSGIQTAIQNAEQVQVRNQERIAESVGGGASAPVNGGTGGGASGGSGSGASGGSGAGGQSQATTCTTENDCQLSLCDCECHKKGTTTEETSGALCGINCLGEYNVTGCECVNGECGTIKTAAQNQNQTPVTPTGNIIEVEIKNLEFNPKELTLTVGDTVVWTNNENVKHRIADSATSKYMIKNNFGSDELLQGEKYNYTFTQPGTFMYQCLIHPVMTGTIVVEAAS